MIEVFKTNIKKASKAKRLIGLLAHHFPGSKVNIDLHDCDKILRIEGQHFLVTKNYAAYKRKWIYVQFAGRCN